VGMKAPNAWGLYDMLGNVWEWCADQWHGSYEGAPADGSPRIDSEKRAAVRVMRGGSWFGDARYVRAAYRDGDDPAARGNLLGFRCARVQVVSGAGARAAARSKPPAGSADAGLALTRPRHAPPAPATPGLFGACRALIRSGWRESSDKDLGLNKSRRLTSRRHTTRPLMRSRR
jgi:hypothetical protein